MLLINPLDPSRSEIVIREGDNIQPHRLQHLAAFSIVKTGLSIIQLPSSLQKYVGYVHRKAILIQTVLASKRGQVYDELWIINCCKLLNLLYTEQAIQYYLSIYNRLLQHYIEYNGDDLRRWNFYQRSVSKHSLWCFHRLLCSDCRGKLPASCHSFFSTSEAWLWLNVRRNKRAAISFNDYFYGLRILGYFQSDIFYRHWESVERAGIAISTQVLLNAYSTFIIEEKIKNEYAQPAIATRYIRIRNNDKETSV